MANQKTDPVGVKNRRKASKRNHGLNTTRAAVPPVQTRNSVPAHLRPDTAEWWASVSAAYRLGSHQLKILTLAAEAWDRGVEAREAIAQVGSVYVDRFAQPRARPEVAIERDSRVAFARLVRELCLDVDSPGESGRPPRAAGSRQRTDLPVLDAKDRLILGLD